MTRVEAIAIARACAKAKPESYYAEPFEPHEWVIDAIMKGAQAPFANVPALPCGYETPVVTTWDTASNEKRIKCELGEVPIEEAEGYAYAMLRAAQEARNG